MQGTNRTIARRLFFRRLIAALIVAALVPATGGAAPKRAPSIKSAWTSSFPERVHGTSVAVGPDGVPWFGLSVQEQSLSIAHLQAGKLEIEALREEGKYEQTGALQFDSQGALWFARNGEGSRAIARRDPDGNVTEFDLPKGEPVNALTLGPEGDIWFVRGGYGEETEAQVGRVTTAGAVTQFPLETGSHPTSITAGPDGALWFSEELAGKIGRITTSGEVQLFALAPKVQPKQIVAGSDGALWFGENARARPSRQFSDRIGRITTDGQASELPIPFGTGTSRLAADPRGVIWFATDEGEFSSISPSGNVGARGCVGSCGLPIEGLALAPDGALWFAAGHASCGGCGGGADLILQNEGTSVGKIPAGALKPADPNGPPAEDPYAGGSDEPPVPTARTLRPYGVNGSEAVLNGFINPHGFPATYRFKWGKTKAYGHLAPDEAPEEPVSPSDTGEEIEEVIWGLCPRTTYHFEIVAYGPGGRTFGGDRTFRTAASKHRPKRCPKR
jgi:virginiamycin B lyase